MGSSFVAFDTRCFYLKAKDKKPIASNIDGIRQPNTRTWEVDLKKKKKN